VDSRRFQFQSSRLATSHIDQPVAGAARSRVPSRELRLTVSLVSAAASDVSVEGDLKKQTGLPLLDRGQEQLALGER
jgi:hypothetical protein